MTVKWDVDSDDIGEFRSLLDTGQLGQDDVSLISQDLLEMDIVFWEITGKAPERKVLCQGVAFDENTAMDAAEELNDEGGAIVTRATTVKDYIETVLGLNVPDTPSTAPGPA